MKKRISLFLAVVLLMCVAVPVALAEDGVCDVCGATDGHEVDCITRCICAEAGHEPAGEHDHVATCPLYKCSVCVAYINQTGHMDFCSTRCHCGPLPEDGTHLENCELYECPECSTYENQGYVHYDNCSKFICPECGQLVNQPEIGNTENCACYFADLYNSTADDMTGVDTYFAFFDKSQENFHVFSHGSQSHSELGHKSVPMSDCPVDFVMAYYQFYSSEGEMLFFELDSFDLDFWDSLNPHILVEPKYFTDIVPAAGLYATLTAMDGEETIPLYNDGGDFEEVEASLLAGEYVVAYFDDFSWQFKLTTDENWPVDAAYCWIDADNLLNLSVTPTQQPTEPDEPTEPQAPTHSEGCGEECTVEGCTCDCHHALLQKTASATTLEEADALSDLVTEEEWSTTTLDTWDFYHAFLAGLPSEYDPVPEIPEEPPVESALCRPTVNFTNSVPIGSHGNGQ